MASVVAVRVARGLLMGGTLMFVLAGPCPVWWGVVGVSVHCWVLREHATPTMVGGVVLVRSWSWCSYQFTLCCGVGVGGAVGIGVRVLFENCTVDASIFVAKFLRAHGGCLGTRSR